MGTTRQIVTLANLTQQTLTRLDGLDHKESEFYSAEILARHFSEAYRIIQRRCEGAWKTEYKQDLRVASGADKAVAYNCPPDLLDNMIRGGLDPETDPEATGVMVVKSDGSFRWLRGISWTSMRRFAGNFSNPDEDAGTPVYWAFAEANFDVAGADVRQIVIWPPSDEAVTDGLIIDYTPDPGFSGIRGIIDPAVELRGQITEASTLRAAVTLASPTVTLSALPTQTVVVNQAFGVRRATSDQLPRYWYRIVETDVENATLDPEQFNVRPDYEQATDAAAIPVISDVSPLEWKVGGTIGYAPVEYALEMIGLQLSKIEGTAEWADRILSASLWESELKRIESAAKRFPGIGADPQRADLRSAGVRFRGAGF